MPHNCAGPASQNLAIVILSIPQPSDNWVGDRPQLDDYAGRIAGVRLGLFVASSPMRQRNPHAFHSLLHPVASAGCRI